MGNNLSLNGVINPSAQAARTRLLGLKQNQGTYRHVAPELSRDTVSFQSIRFGASAIPAAASLGNNAGADNPTLRDRLWGVVDFAKTLALGAWEKVVNTMRAGADATGISRLLHWAKPVEAVPVVVKHDETLTKAIEDSSKSNPFLLLTDPQLSPAVDSLRPDVVEPKEPLDLAASVSSDDVAPNFIVPTLINAASGAVSDNDADDELDFHKLTQSEIYSPSSSSEKKLSFRGNAALAQAFPSRLVRIAPNAPESLAASSPVQSFSALASKQAEKPLNVGFQGAALRFQAQASEAAATRIQEQKTVLTPSTPTVSPFVTPAALTTGMPVHNVTAPVAVIKFGQDTAKLVIVDPNSKKPVEIEYPISFKPPAH